jgi:Transposase IS66 family
VRRFKERGAEYYRETRKTILNEMIKGNVIHADETRIRLQGKTGYVWVFTTLHEVVYCYSETREGSMAESSLNGFKGVLVSDFYAAYDSIPCGNGGFVQRGFRLPAGPWQPTRPHARRGATDNDPDLFHSVQTEC